MWYRLQAVGLTLAGGLILTFILWSLPVSPAQTARAELIPLQFKDQAGEPLTQATLRLVCYPTAESLEPVADVWRETDSQGHLAQPLPPMCYYLAALQLLHEQA